MPKKSRVERDKEKLQEKLKSLQEDYQDVKSFVEKAYDSIHKDVNATLAEKDVTQFMTRVRPLNLQLQKWIDLLAQALGRVLSPDDSSDNEPQTDLPVVKSKFKREKLRLSAKDAELKRASDALLRFAGKIVEKAQEDVSVALAEETAEEFYVQLSRANITMQSCMDKMTAIDLTIRAPSSSESDSELTQLVSLDDTPSSSFDSQSQVSTTGPCLNKIDSIDLAICEPVPIKEFQTPSGSELKPGTLSVLVDGTPTSTCVDRIAAIDLVICESDAIKQFQTPSGSELEPGTLSVSVDGTPTSTCVDTIAAVDLGICESVTIKEFQMPSGSESEPGALSLDGAPTSTCVDTTAAIDLCIESNLKEKFHTPPGSESEQDSFISVSLEHNPTDTSTDTGIAVGLGICESNLTKEVLTPSGLESEPVSSVSLSLDRTPAGTSMCTAPATDSAICDSNLTRRLHAPSESESEPTNSLTVVSEDSSLDDSTWPIQRVKTNPTSLSDWTLAEFDAERTFLVNILKIINPMKIFLQKVSDQPDSLEVEIASYIRLYCKYVDDPDLSVGDSVCIRMNNGMKYYRGTILQLGITEDWQRNAVVFLIDHGTTEDVTTDRVLPLPKKYADIEPKALRCRLFGIAPVGEMWDEGAAELLSDLAGPSRSVTARIVAVRQTERNKYYSVVLTASHVNRVTGELDHTDFADSLVSTGYARVVNKPLAISRRECSLKDQSSLTYANSQQGVASVGTVEPVAGGASVEQRSKCSENGSSFSFMDVEKVQEFIPRNTSSTSLSSINVDLVREFVPGMGTEAEETGDEIVDLVGTIVDEETDLEMENPYRGPEFVPTMTEEVNVDEVRGFVPYTPQLEDVDLDRNCELEPQATEPKVVTSWSTSDMSIVQPERIFSADLPTATEEAEIKTEDPNSVPGSVSSASHGQGFGVKESAPVEYVPDVGQNGHLSKKTVSNRGPPQSFFIPPGYPHLHLQYAYPFPMFFPRPQGCFSPYGFTPQMPHAFQGVNQAQWYMPPHPGLLPPRMVPPQIGQTPLRPVDAYNRQIRAPQSSVVISEVVDLSTCEQNPQTSAEAVHHRLTGSTADRPKSVASPVVSLASTQDEDQTHPPHFESAQLVPTTPQNLLTTSPHPHTNPEADWATDDAKASSCQIGGTVSSLNEIQPRPTEPQPSPSGRAAKTSPLSKSSASPRSGRSDERLNRTPSASPVSDSGKFRERALSAKFSCHVASAAAEPKRQERTRDLTDEDRAMFKPRGRGRGRGQEAVVNKAIPVPCWGRGRGSPANVDFPPGSAKPPGLPVLNEPVCDMPTEPDSTKSVELKDLREASETSTVATAKQSVRFQLSESSEESFKDAEKPAEKNDIIYFPPPPPGQKLLFSCEEDLKRSPVDLSVLKKIISNTIAPPRRKKAEVPPRFRNAVPMPSSSTSKQVDNVVSAKTDEGKEFKKSLNSKHEEKRQETMEDIDKAVKNPSFVRENVQAWIDAHVDWEAEPSASTSQSVANPKPQPDFATSRSVSFEELSRSVSTSPPNQAGFRRLSLDQSVPDEPEFVKATTVSFEELVQLVEGTASERKEPLAPKEESKTSSEAARQPTYCDEACEENEFTNEDLGKSQEKKETRDELQETKVTLGEPPEKEMTGLSRAERFQIMKLTLGVGSEDSYRKRLEEQEKLSKNKKGGNYSEVGKLAGENGEILPAGGKSSESPESENAKTAATENGEYWDPRRTDEYAFSEDGGSYPSLDDEYLDDVLNGLKSLPPQDGAVQPSLSNCFMAENKRRIECQIPLNWDSQDPPTWRALVSHVEGPAEIYVNLLDFPETALLKEIEEMFEELFCQTEVPRQHSFNEIDVGSYWAGCEKGVWYRMKILRILKKTVEVFAVDFGFKTKIEIQNLRHLPDHFMDYYPVIVLCSVYGMKPPNGATDWSAEQKMTFCDLFAIEEMQYLVTPIRLSTETDKQPGEPQLVIMSYAERAEDFIHEIACEMMIAESCFDDEFLTEPEEASQPGMVDPAEGTSRGSINGEVYYSAEDDISDDGNNWDDDFNPMEEDYFSSRNTKFLDDENLDALEHGFSHDNSKYCRFGLHCRHVNCDKKHVDLTEPLPEKELVYGRLVNDLEFPERGSYIELIILRVRDPYQMMAMMPNGPVDVRGIGETKKQDPETLQTLQTALQKHYGPTKRIDFKGLPAIGQLMAAFSSNFNAWYRVRVIESSEEMIEVYYIDYARYEKVHITGLRELADKFTHLPEQAFPVFLSRVGPADGVSWSKQASQHLASMVSGRSLIARVDAIEPLNQCMHVTLWIADGGKVTLSSSNSLNGQLVSKNLAKHQVTSVSAGGANWIPG